MFVGRKNELKTLNQLFKNNKFEFAVIYGRRRIGKSTLIRQFVKDKPHIFFTAVENDAKQNLENLSKAINSFTNTKLKNSIFKSFQDALETIFELSCKEHFIFVIDEFPYLAQVIPQFSSILQMLIDKYMDSSKLFLIICGSSISYIEEKVLAYKAPLFGRRTAQFKLSSLEFKDVITFFPNLNNEEQLWLYGIYGGTPHYINQYNPEISFKENLKRSFLNPNAFLFDEPYNLLKQEVREINRYNSILTAVAEGKTRIIDIVNEVDQNSSHVSYILKNLIEMDLVEIEKPYLNKKSKNSLYKLKDNLFRFYYRFIPPNSNTIYQNLDELSFLNIEPYLNDYMGLIFEKVCKEYLWECLRNNNIPVKFHSLGRWWGANPKTKEQEEIDIIAEQNKDIALFAECKWTNKKVDVSTLYNLIRRSQIFDYPIKYYYLFSKSGYTDECIRKAQEIPNTYLISYDEIIDELKKSK